MDKAAIALELGELLDWICPECSNHEEDLIRFIKKHDTELAFFEAVNEMCARTKWKLLHVLSYTGYNIFKPWYVKALHDVLDATKDKDNCIYMRAVDFYNYYKESFDESAEVERPQSQSWLDMLHKEELDRLSDKIISLIEDGAINAETLEVTPEFAGAVREKQK